jgi:hypothetical protein
MEFAWIFTRFKLMDWATPTFIHDVPSFLGFANFYQWVKAHYGVSKMTTKKSILRVFVVYFEMKKLDKNTKTLK